MSPGAWTRGRWIYFLIAPAICLILFWRAPFTWFFKDDFAWLGLPMDIDHASDLWKVLFSPMAQGTVRLFSERLYFLIFGSLFEMNAFSINAVPFHVCALLTWFADLALAAAIGARLTGSRMAGLAAAILWTCHAATVLPLMWASGYNQILCALCILTAFYARLRWIDDRRGRWLGLEWGAYLAGFGALEIIVIYPAIALLHALCFGVRAERNDRKYWINPLALFIPALVFSAAHFLLVPPSIGPYVLAVDRRLPATFLNYLNWAIAPGSIGDLVGGWRWVALISAPVIGIALLVFSARRLRERNWLPLFCVGWFVLFLLPVLPLPDHRSDYYLISPVLGLAWLAGWAIASAWNMAGDARSVIAARVVVVAAAAAYLSGSTHQIEIASAWYYNNSTYMRNMMRAIDDVSKKHPGSPVIIAGVDEHLVQGGILDDPFRLFGAGANLSGSRGRAHHCSPIYFGASREAVHHRAQSRGADRPFEGPRDLFVGQPVRRRNQFLRVDAAQRRANGPAQFSGCRRRGLCQATRSRLVRDREQIALDVEIGHGTPG